MKPVKDRYGTPGDVHKSPHAGDGKKYHRDIARFNYKL